MNNSARNVSKLTFTIALCIFFLSLTSIHAQQNPKPELKPEPKSNSTSSPKQEPTAPTKTEPKSNSTSPKPEPKSNSTSSPKPEPTAPTKTEPKSNSASPKTGPKPEPKLNSTSPKTEPKPEPKSNPASPKTEPKAEPKTNSPSPRTGPKPEPKSNSASGKPKPTPPTTKPTASSPYHFANHFCLSRRLDVKSTFCLQVLRSSPTSSTVKDSLGLLEISADLAIQFGNKTILFLRKLSQDKKTMPNLKPVIEECLSAYEGYITQYKLLVQEARTEAQLASYDSELAKLEINRCVKALGETKNPGIHAQNKIALDYAKLSQNIADSID